MDIQYVLTQWKDRQNSEIMNSILFMENKHESHKTKKKSGEQDFFFKIILYAH